MFSPGGKRQVLLSIKRAKEQGIDPATLNLPTPIKPGGANSGSKIGKSNASRSISPPSQGSRFITSSPSSPTSPSALPKTAIGIGDDGENGDNDRDDTDVRNICSKKSLTRLLDSEDRGPVMRKLMASTTRYHPEKGDSILLKPFESKKMKRELFRSSLQSSFWLTLTDEEFWVLCDLFDRRGTGVIDGFQFMIAFIKLGTIRKEREAKEHRIKQEEAMKVQKESEDIQRKLELKKAGTVVDFDYTAIGKEDALAKVYEAAAYFDPTTVNMEQFSGVTLNAVAFKEMLRRTLGIKDLTKQDLGAIMRDFGTITQGAGEFKTEVINAEGFLRYFFQLGYDFRDKEKAEQRRRNEYARKVAEEEKIKKMTEAERRVAQSIDMDFSELDVARAEEKLKVASTKYDPNAPGCQSLEGFECDTLGPGAFKELMKTVFGVKLSNAELGYLVSKYQKVGEGRIHCAPFLTKFLKLGQDERHRLHLLQLEKQKKAQARQAAEHEKKIKAVREKKTFKIDYNFNDEDLENATSKLTAASVKYDKSRGASLASFDPIALTPQEFKEALVRTFNIHLTPLELGAVVCTFDKEGKGSVNCHHFLTNFFALGNQEKAHVRTEMLAAQREAESRAAKEAADKLVAQSNKVDIEVSFDFNEEDKKFALKKLRVAAKNYDKNNPSSLDTSGFECKSMEPALFKEMVRRTFGLKLSAHETGALVKHYDKIGDGKVNCSEFLNSFLTLGISERARLHKQQLDKQTEENMKRAAEEAKKLEDNLMKPIEVDKCYTEDDQKSALEKLLRASEGYDKNHPSAKGLEAFESQFSTPGQLRDALKKTFNVTLTARELGYLMALYDEDYTGVVKNSEFITKFLAMGKAARAEKHKAQLEAQRLAIQNAKKEEEEKIKHAFKQAEIKIDWEHNDSDIESATAKLAAAAAKFDKSSPSAPSVVSFQGGNLKPGEFKELLRRTFNLVLLPRELAALATMFKAPCDDLDNARIDPKLFLTRFIKMGCEERDKAKTMTLESQRRYQQLQEQRKAHKQMLAASKTELNLDGYFSAADRNKAIEHLREASTLYDKNAPGAVGLDAFDVKYMPPGEFREVLKRTFNVVLPPKELSAIVREYENEDGYVESKSFLNFFLKLGVEARDKKKLIQLEKQRKENNYRKLKAERILKEQEDKMVLNIDYNYDWEDKESAMSKLAIAAKKYDKSAPGCLSLDGFEAKALTAAYFREMLRRTFNLNLTPTELGALMHHYDPKATGSVPCKDFITSFLQMGINERAKEQGAQLKAIANAKRQREREEREKLENQWAAMELHVPDTFTKNELKSAKEKMTEAAIKFDPTSPGPAGLSGFQGKSMSPAIFREMLKRTFNLLLTDGELAALITLYERDDKKNIICKDFMLKFVAVGTEERQKIRLAQIEKQRRMNEEAKARSDKLAYDLENKIEVPVDYQYKREDFNSAMEKLRVTAANYQRGHASSPSLSGFQGGNMQPGQFKDMLFRTFAITLTAKELGALVKYFDSEGNGTVVANDFLTHFYKTQRYEQNKKRSEQLQAIREAEKRKEREEEERLEREREEEIELTKFNKEDTRSFVEKLRSAAQEYACDNIHFIEPLNGFKGPALGAKAFRQLFNRIFKNQLTFPEVGVLMSLLDTTGTGVIDGPRFLTWFYRLARKEERILLGEIPDDINFESIRSELASSVLESPATAAAASDAAGTSHKRTGSRGRRRKKHQNQDQMQRSYSSSSSSSAMMMSTASTSAAVSKFIGNKKVTSATGTATSTAMEEGNNQHQQITKSLHHPPSTSPSSPTLSLSQEKTFTNGVDDDVEKVTTSVLLKGSMKNNWVLPTTSTNLLDDYKRDYVQYNSKARQELANLMNSTDFFTKKDKADANRQMIDAMSSSSAFLSPLPPGKTTLTSSSSSSSGKESFTATPMTSNKLAPINHTPARTPSNTNSLASSSSAAATAAATPTPSAKALKAAQGFLSPLELKTTPYSPSSKKANKTASASAATKGGPGQNNNANVGGKDSDSTQESADQMLNSDEPPPVDRNSLADFFKGPAPEPPLTGVTLRLQELTIKLRSSQELKGNSSTPSRSSMSGLKTPVHKPSSTSNNATVTTPSTSQATEQGNATKTKEKGGGKEKSKTKKEERGGGDKQDEDSMINDMGNAMRRLKEEQRLRREEKKKASAAAATAAAAKSNDKQPSKDGAGEAGLPNKGTGNGTAAAATTGTATATATGTVSAEVTNTTTPTASVATATATTSGGTSTTVATSLETSKTPAGAAANNHSSTPLKPGKKTEPKKQKKNKLSQGLFLPALMTPDDLASLAPISFDDPPSSELENTFNAQESHAAESTESAPTSDNAAVQ